MVGLPVQLSQSEASSLYSWRSMARTQLALASVSFLKGASGGGGGGGGGEGDENKNKFEKLTDPSQKRGSLFPSADKRICLGCLQSFGQYKWEF